MKKVFFLSLLLLGTITAAGAELRSALLPKPVKINWYIEQLTSKPGEEETYQTVTPAKVAVTHSAKTGDARTDLKITLKNNAAKPQFLRVTATAEIPFDNYRWWNGYVNDNSLKFDPADKILSTWFPANAAIAKNTALILGLDPMLLASRVDSFVTRRGDKQFLTVALPVYLEPGIEFKAGFTAAATRAKYDYHDVIQHWYDLFPNAYMPADRISKDVISGEASYMYWTPNKFDVKFPSDLLRRYYGGRGCWEWCYKPFVRAGDWGISDKWSVGWRNYSKERVQAHRDNITRRLAPSGFQSVAPMWYLNVAWTEWSIWKDHFPGIEYAKENTKRRCWSMDVIYGIYPWGTGYGELFKQSLTTIPKDFPAAKGIGWDSCFAHRQIGEENAGFKNTYPKSFEKGKPMVIEAAGISALLDHARKQFSGNERMANAVNFKLVSPYMIGVRADSALYEGHPMGDPKRLLRIEAMRARLGSPKAVAWHKHASPGRLKWIDWDDMSKAEAQDAYRQVMDNILFLSFYWGGIPAPWMPSVGVKNIMDAVPVLVDLVRQGWQPSPAVTVPENILAARYGKGSGASIVLINPDYKAHSFKVEFPAAYWDNRAALISGSANSPVTSVLDSRGTIAEISLEPRSYKILKVCALVDAKEQLTAAGELVAEAGKAPFHRFQFKTTKRFQADAGFFRSEPGAQVRISCLEDTLRFKNGEPVKYTLDSTKWESDVQAANLLTATLSLVEYPRFSAAELDKETLTAFDLPAKAGARKLFIQTPQELRNEAERIAEWVRFYTQEKSGSYAEPVINGTPGADAVVIKMEVAPDELKSYQSGRAFAEDNTIRVIAKTAGDGKNITLAVLNALDAAYPYYGRLPDTKEFAKIGLNNQTLMPAKAKRPLRPTLLEMMKRNKIR
ncbi:MAG: hypothetical protein IKA71_08370 [Lentisphaeria bacterium]|nr:hypothetical protein [Lentisphaeria bacterium]